MRPEAAGHVFRVIISATDPQQPFAVVGGKSSTLTSLGYVFSGEGLCLNAS